MSRDDDFRRRQAVDEREADRALEEHERLRRINYARKKWECPPPPLSERMAIFDAVSAEIALAERMLRDGLDEESVVGLVMALRRTDPNSVITVSDEAGARGSVEIARMRIDHTLE